MNACCNNGRKIEPFLGGLMVESGRSITEKILKISRG